MRNLFGLFLIITFIGVVPSVNAQEEDDPVDKLNMYMNEVNSRLMDEGVNYRVALAEALTHNNGDYMGISVIAKDVGNKQLSSDFVPGDSRRAQSGDNGNAITYAIDVTDDAIPLLGSLTATQTTSAIQRAMNTWNAQKCSNIALSQNPDFGQDIGIVAYQNGLGGSPYIFADIQHAGWRDINFSGGILAATFTFVFIDAARNATDIDNNGKNDTAFREIYYDPSFVWGNGDTSSFDVETIALHEVGHALSQGHFGTISRKKGVLSAKPRAVMNAIYGGVLRELKGTDNGGHCSNWGQWPNN